MIIDESSYGLTLQKNSPTNRPSAIPWKTIVPGHSAIPWIPIMKPTHSAIPWTPIVPADDFKNEINFDLRKPSINEEDLMLRKPSINEEDLMLRKPSINEEYLMLRKPSINPGSHADSFNADSFLEASGYSRGAVVEEDREPQEEDEHSEQAARRDHLFVDEHLREFFV
jgi:hypothetical protein